MAVVYKAIDKSLNRTVALKVLPSQLGNEPDHVKRFRREAMAAAALNHLNIVTVFSVGEQDGKYHIAMEFVDGRTLAELVREEGKVEVRHAVQMIRDVADALREAHNHGIIHRDIKPHNILVSKKGIIKVMDFGLARVTHDFTDLTADGARLGTPRYMSPEQCESLPLTLHTDIYSLGAVFFELLVGHQAYRAKNALALMRKIVDRPFPDVQAENPDVPDVVADIITKMVAKNVEERYQSAEELLNDLDSWLEGGTAPRATGATIQETRVTQLQPETQQETAAVAQIGLSGKDFVVHFVETDRPWAEWLYARLMESGFTLDWVSWDLPDADTSLRRLIQSVEPGACIVIASSPAYLRAIEKDERNLPSGELGWKENQKATGRDILPVRVLNCALEKVFGEVPIVDMVELDHDEGKRLLIEEAKRRRGMLEEVAEVSDQEETAPEESTPAPTVVGVSNVPVEPNMHFTGRDKILDQIAESFGGKQGVVALVQPERAEAGYGLTELLVEYTGQKKSAYDVIWWVRADAGLTSLLDFTGLAPHLRIEHGPEYKLSDLVAAIKNWLSENSGWLLIFDHVSRFEDVAQLIPPRGKGHVLMTTASTTWPAGIKTIDVGPLEHFEAAEFLTRRTQRFKTEAAAEFAATLAGAPQGWSSVDPVTEGPAADLANSLGNVALALELSGAYIGATKTPLDDYIALYSERHRALWKDGTNAASPTALTATCMSLILDRLSKEAPEALDLMKICAYLHGSEIRLPHISSRANLFPKHFAKILIDTEKLDQCVDLLIRFGLADEMNGVLRVHSLVQASVRRWLEGKTKASKNSAERKMIARLQPARFERKDPYAWFDAAATFVEDTFPTDPAEPDTWALCKLAMPHAVAIAQHAHRTGAALPQSAEIWRRIAAYLSARGELSRAANAYEWALNHSVKTMGAKDKRLSPLYRESGRLHLAMNIVDRAKNAYLAALEIDRDISGDENEDVAESLGQLATISMKQGDFAAAKRDAKKALSIDEKIFGSKHFSLSRDLTILGYISQETNNLKEAAEYFGQALQILEGLKGPKDESISPALKNVAGLLRRTDDHEGASHLYDRALQIDIAARGDMHPEVAQDYANVAFAMQKLQRWEDARKHYENALSIDEFLFGKSHAKAGTHKANLAKVAREEGDLPAAKEYYRDAVKIFRETLGPNHEHTQTAMRGLTKVRERIRQKTSEPKVEK